MKKLLYILLLLLPVLGFAQSRYGVEGVPICWRTPLGVDSSLNRYVIISTTGKPVQTIVYENANGAVVTVAGGSMRYGYCDCIDYTVPDSSVTWAMLTEPVKDSIRFAKRDTFITVPPSEIYFQNTIENPAKFYNNIYLSCKGRTDTSIVVFLAAPVFEEQKGVVYNIKNDSGLVAAFVINYEHLSNNKRFYLLQRGQTAQVRLLPDAANGGNYGWAVNVVWDSIGRGGNIYTTTDSVTSQIRQVKLNNNTARQEFFIGSGDFSNGTDSWFSPNWTSWGYWHSPYWYGGNGLLSANNGVFNMISSYAGQAESESDFIPGSTLITSRSNRAYSSFGIAAPDATYGFNIRSISGSFLGGLDNTDASAGIMHSTDGRNNAAVTLRYDNQNRAINSGLNEYFLILGRDSISTPFGSRGVFRSLVGSTLNPTFGLYQSVEGGVFNWLKVDMPLSNITGDGIEFYSKYRFSNSNPSATPGAISTHIWTAGTASFLRSQHKTISGTTDGSGDITITFDAAMPDATYTVIVTGQGATPYVYMTQSATLATGSVKVRMFTLAGSAATSTAYQISYEVKDTN